MDTTMHYGQIKTVPQIAGPPFSQREAPEGPLTCDRTYAFTNTAALQPGQLALLTHRLADTNQRDENLHHAPPVGTDSYLTQPGSAQPNISFSALGVPKLARWIQPSGPREQGEGVENVEQGIVEIESLDSGQVMLKVTLLVAGFIIGSGGATVRDICRVAGADIKSWTDRQRDSNRAMRVFSISGSRKSVRHALVIVSDAVERYKYLCEGQCAGTFVSRTQKIHGLDFSYQPPPRHLVPYAAAIQISSPPPQVPQPADYMPAPLPPPLAPPSGILSSHPFPEQPQCYPEAAYQQLHAAPRSHPVDGDLRPAGVQGVGLTAVSSPLTSANSFPRHPCHQGPSSDLPGACPGDLPSGPAAYHSATTFPRSHPVPIGVPSQQNPGAAAVCCPRTPPIPYPAPFRGTDPNCAFHPDDSASAMLPQLMRPARWDLEHHCKQQQQQQQQQQERVRQISAAGGAPGLCLHFSNNIWSTHNDTLLPDGSQ